MEDRVRELVEQLVGDASLTEDMDDAPAQQLLEWGIAQVRQLALRTAQMDEGQAQEYLDARMQALRRLMRYINRLMGALPYAEPNALEEHLRQISEAADSLEGLTCEWPVDLQTMARQIGALPADAALTQIVACLRGDTGATPNTAVDEALPLTPEGQPSEPDAPPDAPARRPGAPPAGWGSTNTQRRE